MCRSPTACPSSPTGWCGCGPTAPRTRSGSSSSPPTRSRCAGPRCRGPTASRRPATSCPRSSATGPPRAECAVWAVTDAADPRGAYLGTIDLRPGGGGVAETGFGLHPDGRGSGFMAGALRLACRWWFGEGGVRRALARGARELRLVAGGVVVRVHPARHRPAVPPGPRRRRGARARRVARQPGGRGRHGAPHAVGRRTGAGCRGGRRHPAAAVARPRHRGARAAGPARRTTCRPGACSTPTPSRSG